MAEKRGRFARKGLTEKVTLLERKEVIQEAMGMAPGRGGLAGDRAPARSVVETHHGRLQPPGVPACLQCS